ncbi:MAG: SMC-Scp complex subunit ScpB [Stackebrandtia sp.]
MADWTPPWQRGGRPDTPADEPVAHADLAPDGVRAALEASPQAPAVDASEPEPSADEADLPDPLPFTADLAATIEAILLVSDEPVSEIVLAQTLGRPEPEIVGALRRLAAEYTGDGRGFDLRRQAGGWRYYTREEFAPYVERFVLDGQQVRLTKAALETLAVVAYRQPVTRGRISAIRGVNCDGVIRTLNTRGLIEECGAEPDSGAHLYRTTSLFLEKLGLNSVDELPPLAPFLPDDISEIGENNDD